MDELTHTPSYTFTVQVCTYEHFQVWWLYNYSEIVFRKMPKVGIKCLKIICLDYSHQT